MNPSGPKKMRPPRMENRTKIDDTSSPLPKKYEVRMLSTRTMATMPNKAMPSAPNIFPCR